MKSFACLLLVALPLAGAASAPQKPVKNRAPLAPSTLTLLPLGSVKPTGWLRRQLQIQAEGLSGHLDEFWPSLVDSAWLGGKGENWERGPYFMDGLVPLAYLLDDPKLIAKANKWVSWTIEHPDPSGWIGARNTKDDWWPNFVTLKVLTQYQEATGDARVIPLMQRYAAHQLQTMPSNPLQEWAIFRWGDEVVSLVWLYNRTGDENALKLARLLAKQGYDWKAHFADFQFPGKVTPKDATLKTHVVNNAMAIKTSVVWSQISNDDTDRKALYRLLEVMDRYHGMPQGVHGGDEHYAGNSPVQGTELCAVAEGMFSLELAEAILGDPALGDRLEKIAYNALPGTFDKTMWAHQYDQQPNQVLCTLNRRNWTTNGPESNLYGLEPNFGCCTANMHQGFPKYAANLWMGTADDGLAAIAYGPSEVRTLVKGGVPLTIKEVTEYPVRETIKLTVEPATAVEFPLLLRIPSWAEAASVKVNGTEVRDVKSGTFHRVTRTWNRGDTVELTFPMTPRVSRWYRNTLAIDRGPLVYSLKIGEDWRKLRDKPPAADWEVQATTGWNYGLALNEKSVAGLVKVSEKPVGDYPFSPEGAPVVLTVPGRKLPQWKVENGSAAPPPQGPVTSTQPEESLTLIPYGAAKLRITLFPEVE
jgi:hypothetical protein